MADTLDVGTYDHSLLDNDLLFKMLIIGDSGVGKSCLLLRYADDEFSDCYISTIGVDFKIRTIEMDGKVIKLNMWDTAGQDRFKTITSTFYRGAHGVILVFDLTDMESFHHIKQWMGEIDKFGGGHVAKMLVGNKSDLKNKRVVSTDMAQNYAEELGIPYIETSAKSSENVDNAFKKIISDIKNSQQAQCRPRYNKFSDKENKESPDGFCCSAKECCSNLFLTCVGGLLFLVLSCCGITVFPAICSRTPAYRRFHEK
ncbi:uncharacterized protein LOC127874563 isoform X1 [Dreissena polymorpha]|uniref:uncharacterized protein LOC127874563 isoform X1 n=1 Tax=Dreissena polymorpha TaxID=45954 RepID=UPI002263BF4B|nr:uncharacterized protein LOC127874563 isoform X1 [Dreissena polymorpha]